MNSIASPRFCFVETNTVWKPDPMSTPIWSDRTRTVKSYVYTPYVHITPVRTVRVRSVYSYGPEHVHDYNQARHIVMA